jgi:hypothetical protein
VKQDSTAAELDQIMRDVIASLPLEMRLAGLSLSERLAGLLPRQRLAGLSAEERLAGLSPEQVIEWLTPEQREQLRKFLNGPEDTGDHSTTR